MAMPSEEQEVMGRERLLALLPVIRFGNDPEHVVWLRQIVTALVCERLARLVAEDLPCTVSDDQWALAIESTDYALLGFPVGFGAIFGEAMRSDVCLKTA